MSASRDWLVPHIAAEVYPNYPPLAAWLMALCGQVLGFSEFAMRLPSVLSGLALLAVVARLGRRLGGEQAGLAAALVLAATPAFLGEQVICRANVMVALFSALALERFLVVADGDRRARVVAAFWIALGLAILSKGPVGFVIPALGIAAWIAVERRGAALLELQPQWGVLLLAAVVVPWYGLLWQRTGGESLRVNLLLENVDAALHGYQHTRPFWFYAARFPLQMLPWILLSPLLWCSKRGRAVRVWLGWLLALLLLLSAAHSKRASYLAWLAPAFALLVGAAFLEIRGRVSPARARFVARVGITTAVFVAFGNAGYNGWVRSRRNAEGRAGMAFCQRIDALLPQGTRLRLVDAVDLPQYAFYLNKRLERETEGPGVYLAVADHLSKITGGRSFQLLATKSEGQPLALIRVLE
jgi:4-amino-4-deoxy-L-arabinose transferase-like glycosyltransferase